MLGFLQTCGFVTITEFATWLYLCWSTDLALSQGLDMFGLRPSDIVLCPGHHHPCPGQVGTAVIKVSFSVSWQEVNNKTSRCSCLPQLPVPSMPQTEKLWIMKGIDLLSFTPVQSRELLLLQKYWAHFRTTISSSADHHHKLRLYLVFSTTVKLVLLLLAHYLQVRNRHRGWEVSRIFILNTLCVLCPLSSPAVIVTIPKTSLVFTEVKVDLSSGTL